MADFFATMNRKRTNPMLAKTRAAAKAAETVKETTETVEEKPVVHKKLNPMMMFRKKKPDTAKTEEAAATTAEAESVALEEAVASVKEKTETAKEDIVKEVVAKVEESVEAKETKEAETPVEKAETPVEKATEEPKAEEPAKESAPAEEKAETKEEPAKAEEEKPAAKPKRKRRTHAEVVAEREAKAAAEKAKKEAIATASENAPATADDTDDAGILVSDYREVNAFDTTMTPEEAAGVVNQGLVSSQFRAYQRTIIDRLNDIKITPDMNPGAIKYTLAELDGLNVEVGLQLAEKKQLINSWTNKEYGVLTAYRISHSVGKNEGERKRNAFAALASATINGHQVNVLALITSANFQLEFFQGISDIIKAKREMLITMSSQVKLENSSMMIQDSVA